MASMKNGACNLGEKEEKKRKERAPCIEINLSEYNSISSLDLTKECYSFQIVFSYLLGTNPIYCGT